jgi:hypothetical protein
VSPPPDEPLAETFGSLATVRLAKADFEASCSREPTFMLHFLRRVQNGAGRSLPSGAEALLDSMLRMLSASALKNCLLKPWPEDASCSWHAKGLRHLDCAYLRPNCHAKPIRWPAPRFAGSNPICPARQSVSATPNVKSARNPEGEQACIREVRTFLYIDVLVACRPVVEKVIRCGWRRNTSGE